MEEERSPYEPGSPEPSTMVTANGNGGTQSSAKRLIAVGLVLIVSLLIAGLFLPPISLAERLAGNDGEQEAVAEAPDVAAVEGLTVLAPGGETVNAVALSPDEAATDERAAPMASAVRGPRHWSATSTFSNRPAARRSRAP